MRQSSNSAASALVHLEDEELLSAVQRQTFRFFWEGSHPASGLARDRQKTTGDPDNDLVAIGGSGFGIMAIVVAVERGWVSRNQAVCRLGTMLSCLERTPRYHGVFPHFINGRTAETIPFTRKDDGGDVVETAFLFQGLLCARQYFDSVEAKERSLRDRINRLWREVEWNWYGGDGGNHLHWHWSPNRGWSMDRRITGWNEGLLAYVLAAGSAEYPVGAEAYHEGFASGSGFLNGRSYHGIELPLGMSHGGPLFIAHYSFCGLDPRGLTDRYADYWQQNIRHTRINYEHCVANPFGYEGYGPDCWGLTSSHGPSGYVAHAPDRDLGVITPSAALSSFPYAPDEAMRALRGFLLKPGHRIWGRFGFVDAFCESRNWYARTYLAINQGPIVIMIENFRTGLLWRLFMAVPEVRNGFAKLGFSGPHL